MDGLRCGSDAPWRDGQTRLGGQRWRCRDGRRRFTRRSPTALSGQAFSDDVISVSVRGYVRFRVSDAAVAEGLAERGLPVDRSTS